MSALSWYRLTAAAVLAWPNTRALAQAEVREVTRTYTTYPYSDADPIPRIGRIYPYYRWDGFTSKGEARSYKVVELENEYLKVSIIPEIGGKVWSAIDKATGRSMIYDNQVVKFRDVAMRGPWTSGGIEANYGVIGHTPNVATPVDYLTRTNADGSVSCTIGALDLLTRTQWRIEINLPKDKAYFTTASSWFNTSPLEQPYYTWMNTAIPVGDDLEFVYPGNRFLGHDGEVGDWPVNSSNGKSISRYRNNDFGGYKSYHVFGAYTDFFGAWWHSKDFGMVRYAAHDEKPGKKLWIWGLSRQGMIWEQLLTDADGQYTEVQSGRLFNQTAEGSTRTPFKHRGFAPHASERWTEYWFPVRGMGGMVAASPYGALNVKSSPAGLVVSLLGVQPVRDTLTIRDGTRLLRQRVVALTPRAMVVDTLPASVNPATLHITLGTGLLDYQADPAKSALSRPVEGPADFDWKSAYGSYLQGKEYLRDREFGRAREAFEQSLQRDAHFLPAIGEVAALHLRSGNARQAVDVARRGLAIDTYDPLSNYIFGLGSRQLGHLADARDGLDIASQSGEWRVAAFSELAKLYLAGGDLRRAEQYATKALDYDRSSMDALQVRAVTARAVGNTPGTDAARANISAVDPVGHFVRVEQFLSGSLDGTAVRDAIRNEMPHESLLELAVWYKGVGRDRDADRVLSLAADHPEVAYWRAWLRTRLGEADAASWLTRASALTPRLVLPFRTETRQVLEWARGQRDTWQTTYYLALVTAHLGDRSAALTLLRGLGDAPEFAPLYAARALLADSTGALRDWRRAAALDTTEWRYGRIVAELLLATGDSVEALTLTTRYASRYAQRTPVALLHARALLRVGRVADAVTWLDKVEILPAEGAAEAHVLYREANLRLAIERFAARDTHAARTLVAKARAWPERLGTGKPYAADVDERLEDWMDAVMLRRDTLPPRPRGSSDGVVQRVMREWDVRGLSQ